MLDSLRFVAAMLVSRSARKSEEGATATEYGLLVGLIALGIVLMVTAFGTALGGFFTDLGTTVGTW